MMCNKFKIYKYSTDNTLTDDYKLKTPEHLWSYDT